MRMALDLQNRFCWKPAGGFRFTKSILLKVYKWLWIYKTGFVGSLQMVLDSQNQFCRKPAGDFRFTKPVC